MTAVLQALQTVRTTLPQVPDVEQVLFCRFSARDLHTYKALLAQDV